MNKSYNITEYGLEPDIRCPDCGHGGLVFVGGETVLLRSAELLCHVCGANFWRVIKGIPSG